MATSERCERTDLLVEQCAHCRGHDEEGSRPREKTGPRFAALFRSPCGGADDIEAGDEIVMWRGEAWHAECAEADGVEAPAAPRKKFRSEDPYG